MSDKCTSDQCMNGRIGYAVCDDSCDCKCGTHTKYSQIFGKKGDSQ